MDVPVLSLSLASGQLIVLDWAAGEGKGFRCGCGQGTGCSQGACPAHASPGQQSQAQRRSLHSGPEWPGAGDSNQQDAGHQEGCSLHRPHVAAGCCSWQAAGRGTPGCQAVVGSSMHPSVLHQGSQMCVPATSCSLAMCSPVFHQPPTPELAAAHPGGNPCPCWCIIAGIWGQGWQQSGQSRHGRPAGH